MRVIIDVSILTIRSLYCLRSFKEKIVEAIQFDGGIEIEYKDAKRTTIKISEEVLNKLGYYRKDPVTPGEE